VAQALSLKLPPFFSPHNFVLFFVLWVIMLTNVKFFRNNNTFATNYTQSFPIRRNTKLFLCLLLMKNFTSCTLFKIFLVKILYKVFLFNPLKPEVM
jgi:hypothetical protein